MRGSDGKSGLKDERGGDDQQDAGELESQATFLGADALQPHGHVARVTQPSSDEDVERNNDDDRDDGDQTAVDRVHDEVGKFVTFTTATDLRQNIGHYDSYM